MTGRATWRRIPPALLGGAMAAVLVACGGSGGSGSGNLLGGSQQPDPVVVDVAVMYVKRPLLVDDNGDLIAADLRDPTAFMPGAELYFRDRASPSAAAADVTAGIFPNDADGNPPLYDVKDLSSSFDGKQMVFAMRAPEIPGADPADQPTWNIWIYDVNSRSMHRVIVSDITAELGQDVSPRFLPDGRIVFASTRQRQSKAILLDEGKPQFAALDENRNVPALTLHVMNDDGSDIHQISFNQSHDTDPSVLTDGRVVYARWDDVASHDSFSLYTLNPDGTEQRVLYGIHSHDSGPNGESVEFLKPQELPDGRILVTLRDSTPQTHFGGAPVAIDTADYTDNDQPTYANQGQSGPAQELLVPGSITLDGTPSPSGHFASVSPLFDGTDRLLVSWSQCRLLDPASTPQNPIIVPCTSATLAVPGIQEAPPLYGIWMFDTAQGTQQPIVAPEEGFAYSEAVALEPKTLPAVRLDKTPGLDLDPDLVAEGVGEIDIGSVYDFDGTAVADIQALRDPAATSADQRPARFVRIVKAVSIPDDTVVQLDGAAFGVSQAQSMREIIGYAPVEPDGSVKVKVPANIAFGIDVLDADGRRRSQRHQYWLTVRPGEVMRCNGCHSGLSELPHGRPDAEAPSANPGAPADGLPFPNTDPTLFADAGETMAETYARLKGVPEPTVDIHYDDVWTDPNVRAKDVSFSYNYSALSTPAPVDPGCVSNWTASCRIVINYETIVHPLWSVPRVAADGVTNVTCTSCHAPTDANGVAQVPAAQLDLSDGPSPDVPAQFNSYRQLLVDRNQQALQGTALAPVLVQDTDANGNPLFQTDGNGNLILDANGNPIPILVPATVGAPMSPNGARASSGFFNEFDAGGTHAGWLSTAELKLISEWLDGGAQYFNDPFAVPQN